MNIEKARIMQIVELENLAKSSIDNHYLRLALSANRSYWDGFVKAIEPLKYLLNARKFDDLIINKLQLGLQQFEEKQFIQIACETTVTSYFARKYPTTFLYETRAKVTTKKDVDCSYTDGAYKYFIEVKCPDFKEKERISAQDGFKISAAGRIPNFGDSFADLSGMLAEGQKNIGETPKAVLRQKNMDNNLKDFLVSAHEKFNDASKDDEVNVLVVGCGDASDMQAWHSYMYSNQGLFTKDSFCKHNKYENVDMVVLTNLYHRHNQFFEKQNLNGIWFLENACNFVFFNPYRKSLKKSAMMHFIETFTHYTDDFINYDVPGPAPQYVKDVLKIPHFIKDMLTDKGVVLF